MIEWNEGINDSAAAGLSIRSPGDQRGAVVTRYFRHLRGSLVVFPLLAAGACSSDDATGPLTGSLEVLLTMEGVDLDSNGGSLVLNGDPVGALTVDVRLNLEEVEPGIHVVMVTGIEPNCSSLRTNERNVTVRAGLQASEQFRFLCESTGGKDQGDGGGEID
jgi:hypothetical protein